MLEHLRQFIADNNFSINNVAVQIMANEPKIRSRRLEAQVLLSSALGAPVSIAATTTDGMGFTGRGEGVFVMATALVVPL
jgi:2-C-methyl-D-erythritol 2,4-cyclodiphosphate synthase